MAAIDREQPIERKKPGQIAQAFGNAVGCDCRCPHDRTSQRPAAVQTSAAIKRWPGSAKALAAALQPGRCQQAGERPGAPQRRAIAGPGRRRSESCQRAPSCHSTTRSV